jgi:hypothetical protein
VRAFDEPVDARRVRGQAEARPLAAPEADMATHGGLAEHVGQARGGQAARRGQRIVAAQVDRRRGAGGIVVAAGIGAALGVVELVLVERARGQRDEAVHAQARRGLDAERGAEQARVPAEVGGASGVTRAGRGAGLAFRLVAHAHGLARTIEPVVGHEAVGRGAAAVVEGEPLAEAGAVAAEQSGDGPGLVGHEQARQVGARRGRLGG